MPSAIKKDHELKADGLVSILVEAQGADDKQLEGFLWQRFPDNECFSSVGCFVPIPESRGIPHGAVIGVDGKLLWAGNPLRDAQQIEELVAEQLKLVKKGWGDSSEARKVRAQLYGRGSLASAASMIAAMEGGEKDTLQRELDKRYAVLKTAVETLKKQGCWLRAQERAVALQKAVGRHESWSAEVAEIVAGFATDDAKAEIAVDKKLGKIAKGLRKGKVERAVKQLQKLVDNGGQTAVGGRAARMLAALTAGA